MAGGVDGWFGAIYSDPLERKGQKLSEHGSHPAALKTVSMYLHRHIAVCNHRSASRRNADASRTK
jgi:hypothetical protein